MSEKENNPLNSESNNFDLPGDYFRKSAGSIFNKIEWQDEHKNYPELLRHKNKNTFTIPLKYFDKNEARLELSNLPNLASLQKQNPFKVSANYFEETGKRLFAENFTVQENELHGFEKLNAIPKLNSFATADNYFNTNKTRLAAVLGTKEPARIINLFPVKVMYAAAALLVVALGFWAYSFYFTPVEQEDCGTLACIDRVELVKTKALENLDNEELYEIVNTSKLEEKLNSDTDKNAENIKADSSSKDDALDDMLDEI